MRKLEKLLAALEGAVEDYARRARDRTPNDEVPIKRAFTQIRRELELENAKWGISAASSNGQGEGEEDEEGARLRRIQHEVNELESRFRAAISDEARETFRINTEKRAELFSTSKTVASSSSSVNTNGGVGGSGISTTTSHNGSKSRSEMLGDAELLAQARDANAALLRTREIMARELERVSKVSEVLSHDTEMLKGVGKEYEAVAATVDASSSALNRMHLREKLDKYMVYIGLGFFLLVVLYILKRRLLPMFSPLVWLAEFIYSATAAAANPETTTTTISAPQRLGDRAERIMPRRVGEGQAEL